MGEVLHIFIDFTLSFILTQGRSNCEGSLYELYSSIHS